MTVEFASQATGVPGAVQEVSQVRQNVIANFVGRGWTAVVAFACIPLYVRFLGVEAFGLVVFFTTLQAVFAVLDMGLSTTLNRQLARLRTDPTTAREQRNLVRTLERLYWLASLAVALVILPLAPVIANQWIRAEHLSATTVESAVRLMGLVVAFQFPFTLYQGGLMGLQRQVLLNGIVLVNSTLRYVGVLGVLFWVSATVEAFFVWQVIVSALQTAAAAWFLWRVLPSSRVSPHFDKHLLGKIWRFAAGMTGISVTVVLLVQMDKVILSKILTLEMFGYYGLASVVAGGLYTVIVPIFGAVFPRFSELVARGDNAGLTRLYHRSCQMMSLVLLPIAVVVAIFSREIMLLWTGSGAIAERTYPLVTLLTIGTALNGLMNVPYAMQLAHGWTTLALYGNAVALLVLVPALVLLATHFGAVGAAAVWVALNAGYVFISLQIMHRRLLPGEIRKWYLIDVGRPLAAVLIVVVSAQAVLRHPLTGVLGFLVLALVGLATLTAAVVVSPLVLIGHGRRQRAKAEGGLR